MKPREPLIESWTYILRLRWAAFSLEIFAIAGYYVRFPPQISPFQHTICTAQIQVRGLYGLPPFCKKTI